MKTRSLVAILSLLFCGISSASGQTLDWTRQLGTSSDDVSYGVSADGLGNVYISGQTGGDAFLSKYDSSGTFQWTRQLGTSEIDRGEAVSADGLGNVYMSGWTRGSLEGSNAGSADAFLSKYDASGMLQWTEQLGTSELEESNAVSADGLGNVYISGLTQGSLGGPHAGGNDAFLSKYDASGMLQWTEQLGTTEPDSSFGVSADGLGNVYISGFTLGNLNGANAGGMDAFLSKYDASGTFQWTRQLGTSSNDWGFGVSADGLGNVYMSGRTQGSLGGPHAGGLDAFLSKYDASGMLQWTEQLGTSRDDVSYGVSADGLGNVYMSGSTEGSLGGPIHAGGSDAFLSKYDASGMLQWTEQLGTNEPDPSLGVSADGLGNVYVSGLTLGNLNGANAGGKDAFVAKYSDIPEPCTVNLIAGRSIDIGDVTTQDNGDGTWTVTYETTGSWMISATHLHVACTLMGIPQNRRGNPQVGMFDHAADHDPLVQTFTYEVPDPGCDCPFFAAHAVVVDTEDCIDNVCREATAWGEGPSFPGRNWAMYFQCGCDP